MTHGMLGHAAPTLNGTACSEELHTGWVHTLASVVRLVTRLVCKAENMHKTSAEHAGCGDAQSSYQVVAKLLRRVLAASQVAWQACLGPVRNVSQILAVLQGHCFRELVSGNPVCDAQSSIHGGQCGALRAARSP